MPVVAKSLVATIAGKGLSHQEVAVSVPMMRPLAHLGEWGLLLTCGQPDTMRSSFPKRLVQVPASATQVCAIIRPSTVMLNCSDGYREVTSWLE